MTDFINKMERKYGRYAIKNLVVYLLGAYAVGYVLFLVTPTAYSFLQLNPELVMKGQVWRLISWVCSVPDFFVLDYFYVSFSVQCGQVP